jgi:hypothetical protein
VIDFWFTYLIYAGGRPAVAFGLAAAAAAGVLVLGLRLRAAARVSDEPLSHC